ncbi:hypothetical protein DYC03_12565 [Vibrio cholerae]|nr:hypothetical protein [Vibrio cholerae]EGR4283295.1 hypothetical protein [Vibrio cholerae]
MCDSSAQYEGTNSFAIGSCVVLVLLVHPNHIVCLGSWDSLTCRLPATPSCLGIVCLEWFICAHGDKFSCCLAAIQVAWVCHFKTLINRAGKAFWDGHKKTTLRWFLWLACGLLYSLVRSFCNLSRCISMWVRSGPASLQCSRI